MKKDKTEELIVKWIDEILSPEEETELSVLIADEPSLQAELDGMKAIAAKVGEEVPQAVEPPYGDFFNSQLMRKVDLQVQSQTPAKKAERWWESLRWAWAPVGALALVLSFFAGHRIARPAPAVAELQDAAETISALPTVYFAEDSLDAEVISNSDGEVSAILVKGLAAISDDIDFVTVTTSAQLPKSFESSEARRFH